jgi:hypothetical protein
MSCDTILPLMLEVKKNNDMICIQFVSFDYQTYSFIKKNKLLYQAINKIGDIICLGRKKNSMFFDDKNFSKFNYRRLNFIPHIIKTIPFFIKLLYRLACVKVIFIHFRALNLWPCKFLYFLNKNNTIFSNADSSGWSETGYKARRSVHTGVDTQFSGAVPCGKKVIAFSKLWPFLKHPSLRKSTKYIIESSHNRKVWLDYLKNSVVDMLRDEHKIGAKNSYCTLVLGHIGIEKEPGSNFLRNKDSWTTLVEDILDIIFEESPHLTILIKPHIITDMKVLKSILNKRKHIKTDITYLHPALLAVKAKFTIASHYTTSFQSVYYVGSLTIEYTNQKDEYAKKLNYKAMRPEFTSHFFNNDEGGFRNLLGEINNEKINKNLNTGSENDPSGIIHYLSK